MFFVMVGFGVCLVFVFFSFVSFVFFFCMLLGLGFVVSKSYYY